MYMKYISEQELLGKVRSVWQKAGLADDMGQNIWKYKLIYVDRVLFLFY